MVRAEDVAVFLRRRPFSPFRVYATDGRSYDIRHPDQAIVSKAWLNIGVGGKRDVPDHFEYVAILHIVRIEEINEAQRQAG